MAFEQEAQQCWSILSKIVLRILNIFVQAALKAAQQTQSGRDEDITALRVEIQVVLKKACIPPPPPSLFYNKSKTLTINLLWKY